MFSKKRSRNSFEGMAANNEDGDTLKDDRFSRSTKQKKDGDGGNDGTEIRPKKIDPEKDTNTCSTSFFTPQYSSSSSTCDNPISTPQDIKPSKRAQKRFLKKEALKETKHIRRKAEKERRKINKKIKEEKLKEGQPEGIVPFDTEHPQTDKGILFTEEERARLREESRRKKEEKLEEWISRCNANSDIVIDCSYQDKLTERELTSLKQQIMYSYSSNKKAEEPSRIYITSCNGRLAEGMSTVSGHATWPGISFHDDSYLKLFPKEEIVYLTSDSPNEIDRLDSNCKYIIGGIVDHGRLKNLTYDDAIANEVRTAKFPLTKYVKLEASSVLTVNHVVDIILALQRFNGDWLKTLETCLPNRKKWKFLHNQNQENLSVESKVHSLNEAYEGEKEREKNDDKEKSL